MNTNKSSSSSNKPGAPKSGSGSSSSSKDAQALRQGSSEAARRMGEKGGQSSRRED